MVLRRVITGAVVTVRLRAVLPMHSPLLLQLICTRSKKHSQIFDVQLTRCDAASPCTGGNYEVICDTFGMSGDCLTKRFVACEHSSARFCTQVCMEGRWSFWCNYLIRAERLARWADGLDHQGAIHTG